MELKSVPAGKQYIHLLGQELLIGFPAPGDICALWRHLCWHNWSKLNRAGVTEKGQDRNVTLKSKMVYGQSFITST